MTQEEFNKIAQTTQYTLGIINQLIDELEVGDTRREIYREVILMALHREKTEAALQMMEYCKKQFYF